MTSFRVLAVALLAALAAPAGPAGAAGGHGLAVLEGTWVLAEIAGQPVGRGADIERSIHFTYHDGFIRGFDGCNTFSGDIDQPGRIVATQRGCPPDMLLLPLDLGDPRPQLARARLKDGALILPLPGGAPGTARFEPYGR